LLTLPATTCHFLGCCGSLSLIQFSVGIELALLAGTLGRVTIVELQAPSTIVGVMLALPLLFAPLRALIGFRYDIH
jgi:BCD family chlorophyll transporter-like MFS transporter